MCPVQDTSNGSCLHFRTMELATYPQRMICGGFMTSSSPRTAGIVFAPFRCCIWVRSRGLCHVGRIAVAYGARQTPIPLTEPLQTKKRQKTGRTVRVSKMSGCSPPRDIWRETRNHEGLEKERTLVLCRRNIKQWWQCDQLGR